SAYIKAAEVPLSVMEEVKGLLTQLQIIAAKGNINSTSDAGVGALMAKAACDGAMLNVEANVSSITDQAVRDKLIDRAEEIRCEVDRMAFAILETVRARIKEN
ncbi:MAG TPA: cyclodeaminase/cyclohydrolase family protein, partial [Armatimonadota bacterium]|nr:cyclodeaminase/cyclohydrolase family protein [Armatimonadota bacterium]